jgi:hypothetical protein
VSVRPVMAVADTVTKNALPNLFRFTYPTFSSCPVRPGRGTCTNREVRRSGWTEPTWNMNGG